MVEREQETINRLCLQIAALRINRSHRLRKIIPFFLEFTISIFLVYAPWHNNRESVLSLKHFVTSMVPYIPNLKSATVVMLFLAGLKSSFAQKIHFDPPWNKPPESAVQFTVYGIDNLPDIYGDINDPQLVVFLGGNQFMVIEDLLAAFKKRHPLGTLY